MAIDKDVLFKVRLPEGEVEIPGVGTVRVRGLSRDEVFAVQNVGSTQAAEQKILARGMVEPAMTELDVSKWQAASPGGELEAVVEKIRNLSGLNDGAEKDAVINFREGSEPGV